MRPLSTENWIKDLLSTAPPIRAVSPTVSLSHQEASISLLSYPKEDRQNENHNHRKLIKLIIWTTVLSNSMKLWAMPCRATQHGQIMLESSEKMWSTREVHLLVSNLFAFSYCSRGSQGKNTGLPFPSPVDHVFSELSTMMHTSWVALHGMAHSFIELDKTPWSLWSVWLVFCDCGFILSALCWIWIRGLWKLLDRRGWLRGKLGLVLMGGAVLSSVQFSSVAQSCPTLCDPMNLSTPGLSVHHHLPEITQSHVHRVCDAIQPSHPGSSPSPPALNLSNLSHQSLFQWVNSSHEVSKVLEQL